MTQTAGRNQQQLKNATLEIGTTEGKENEMEVKLDGLPIISPTQQMKIGNTKGDKNKTSIIIGSGSSRTLNPIWIVGGVILSAANSIVVNILSAYIQDRYGILTQMTRLARVVLVFVLTLLFAMWLAVRSSK